MWVSGSLELDSSQGSLRVVYGNHFLFQDTDLALSSSPWGLLSRADHIDSIYVHVSCFIESNFYVFLFCFVLLLSVCLLLFYLFIYLYVRSFFCFSCFSDFTYLLSFLLTFRITLVFSLFSDWRADRNHL